MKKTVRDYTQSAIAASRFGHFTTKAAQKDALDDLNRAYHLMRGNISYGALREAGISVWDVPHDLHQIREKHRQAFEASHLNFDAVLEKLDLRNKIKAMEIVKAAPKPKAAPTGNQATHQGSCQICGRVHKVNNRTGRIATHGYTTRFGYFEGECSGRGQLPYEKSCDYLVKVIDQQRDMIKSLMSDPSAVYDQRRPKITNEMVAGQIAAFIERAERRVADWKPANLIPVA